MKETHRYFFPGDPSKARQPYVHNDDLGDAILLAVKRRKELPEDVTLLIGEDESLTYDELQRSFTQLIYNEEWTTRRIPPAAAKLGMHIRNFLPLERPATIPSWMIDTANDNIELDISTARTLLGWEPRHSLRDVLPKMVSTLKADPFTWYSENGLDLPLWLKEKMPEPIANQKLATDEHELVWLEEQVQREIEKTPAVTYTTSTYAPSKPSKKRHNDTVRMSDEAA